MQAVLGVIIIVVLVVVAISIGRGWSEDDRPDDTSHCSRCGKEITEVKPCPYNRYHYYSCDDCCEECRKYEPFHCEDYERRKEMKHHDRGAE